MPSKMYLPHHRDEPNRPTGTAAAGTGRPAGRPPQREGEPGHIARGPPKGQQNPCVSALRHGQVIRYGDYMDPIALARRLDRTGELAAAFTTP